MRVVLSGMRRRGVRCSGWWVRACDDGVSLSLSRARSLSRTLSVYLALKVCIYLSVCISLSVSLFVSGSLSLSLSLTHSVCVEQDEHPDHCVVIKYVPHVGDSKRAMDEYVSEIFMGGTNTIIMHNTCEVRRRVCCCICYRWRGWDVPLGIS